MNRSTWTARLLPSFYYMLLAGQDGREFSATTDLSPELKWTKAGDNVAVTAQKGETGAIPLMTFDNLNVDVKP